MVQRETPRNNMNLYEELYKVKCAELEVLRLLLKEKEHLVNLSSFICSCPLCGSLLKIEKGNGNE